MNNGVCKLCRRYSNLMGNTRDDLWYCGKTIRSRPSHVIPCHSELIVDDLRPITKAMTRPPEWCERVLEQTILEPEEKVELEKDSSLVYDGNRLAEMHVWEKSKNSYN